MIQGTQKLIKIGTSTGITLPAKDLKKDKLSVGHEVNYSVDKAHKFNAEDQKVIDTARDILSTYKKDFDNLAKR